VTRSGVMTRIATLAAVVTACHANVERPAARVAASGDEVELQFGRLIESLAHGLTASYEDAKLAQYVEAVGQRIAARSERPELPWRFIVLDAPAPYAHAVPGGGVLVSRGALAYLNSQAELAAVLAHEVAHVARRHSEMDWRRELPVAREDQEAVEQQTSREDDRERQADAVAVRYLEAAGYHPWALGWALQDLERGHAHDAGTSAGTGEAEHDPHPPLLARLARIDAASTRDGGEVGRSRYLARLNGLELGAGRHDARVSRGRFVVPGELSFELPRGFRGELECGVASFSDGRASPTELTIVQVRTPIFRELVTSEFKAQPFTASELAGHRLMTAALQPHGSTGHAALIDAHSSLVMLAVQGQSPAERLSAILATVRREAEIPPAARTIRIEAARESQRFERFLAERCPSTAPAEAFALNGVGPNARILSGTLVKCVALRSGPY